VSLLTVVCTDCVRLLEIYINSFVFTLPAPPHHTSLSQSNNPSDELLNENSLLIMKLFT